MRRILCLSEIWLAALLVAASCTVSHQPETLVRQGRVEKVETVISRDGQPTVLITISFISENSYEQDTREYPFGSREAILFGHTGRCVEVREVAGGDLILRPCE